MTKLYKKSEITFAILWIVVYVVLSSLADQFSENIGVVKSITAALHIVMSLILFFWIQKNDLNVKYGFCRSTISPKHFLFYIPLVVIASSALWSGIDLHYNLAGTVFYVISMCCVGFLEEVIFRGLLFRAMEKDNPKLAIIVSALTFGIGHIVNLFNGSGKDITESVIQIVFAILVGLVLVLIFYYGGSLIPCIIFHSVNNALFAFESEGTMDPTLAIVLNIMLIIVVLGGYSFYLIKAFSKNAE